MIHFFLFPFLWLVSAFQQSQELRTFMNHLHMVCDPPAQIQHIQGLEVRLTSSGVEYFNSTDHPITISNTEQTIKIHCHMVESPR